MPYTPQSWSDGSGGGTPVSAARLTHMEDGIEGAHTAAATAQNQADLAVGRANTALTNANTAQTAAATAQATANAAVSKSLVTAKGDLIIGTGPGAVAKLPVLADSRLFEADSTDPNGVKWGRRISVADIAPSGPRVGDLWLKPVGTVTPPPPAFISYVDPYTTKTVTRLTLDGASTGAINYLGQQAGPMGGSWSPSSTRIVYAKEVPGSPLLSGIYVFDLTDMKAAPLCTVDSHLAYPVFSHDGTEVFFIAGANGTPNGSGNKPFQLRKVTVPTTLDYNQPGPSDVSSLVRDIRADAEAASKNLISVTQLTKNNHAGNSSWKMFAVQAESSDGFRTLIYQPTGSTPYTGSGGWTFTQTANTVENFHLWGPSPNTGVFRIASYRGSTRGVWSVSSTGSRVFDFQTSAGAITLDKTAWAWWASTPWDVWMGQNRDPWHWQEGGSDSVESSRGPLPDQTQFWIDVTNPPATNLGLVRVLAAECGAGAHEAHIYKTTLQDFNVGGTSPYGAGSIWASQIRPNKRWVGHRNKISMVSNSSLKRYMPNLQVSPDGSKVLWQSTGENSITTGTTTYAYPSGTCGAAGSVGSTTACLDLYITSMT